MEKLLRWALRLLIRSLLWAIGPRMTLWSLYCVFAEAWSDSCPVELMPDGTKCMVPYKGGIETETWAAVCTHLSESTDICETYEESVGFGHRSHPFIVDRGGETSQSGGFSITCGPTTCRSWIKTTGKFPWLERD